MTDAVENKRPAMMPQMLVFKWDREAGVMIPWPRFAKVCAEKFQDGEDYKMEVSEIRSMTSHAHFFASINEAWKNLPEDIATDFPTAEHLRKWGLVQAGFCQEKNFVCESPAKARELGVLIRWTDQYAIITIKGNVLRVFHAESQAFRNMDKKQFQESKTKVLDIISGLIGTDTKTLEKQNPK